MNSKICLFLCLPVLLLSCSPYKKVSISNFKIYDISDRDRSELEFVLKKQSLHYFLSDNRYQVNDYQGNSSSPYKSYNVHLQDNIVIPKGATGRCIEFNAAHFIIDFGKDVRITFSCSEKDNNPGPYLEIDQKKYFLDADHRKARLYFNTRQ